MGPRPNGPDELDRIGLTKAVNGGCTHGSHAEKQVGRVIIALILAALASTSCSTQPDSDLVEFPVAEEPVLPDLKDIDEGLADYITVRHNQVIQYPTSGSERGRLAMTYDVNNWSRQSIPVYEQAHLLDPYEFMWPYFVAHQNAKIGEYEEAVGMIEVALTIDPDYSAAWLWLGTWLLRLDRFDDAELAFERAYSIDQSFYSIVGKARVKLMSGNSQESIDLLEPLRVKTLHPEIFRLLATAYNDLGRSNEANVARALSKQEAALNWPDPIVIRREKHIRGFGGRLARAQRLLQANRVEESLRELLSLRTQYGDRPSLVSTLAWAYSAQGETTMAMETLQIGIESSPEHQPYYTQLGDLVSLTGNLDTAEGLLRKSVELNESDSEAHLRLGIVLMQQQRFDEAISAFNAVLDIGSSAIAEAHLHLGTIEGYRQQWDEAARHLKRTIELNPRHIAAHERLCYVYIEARQFDELDAALLWTQQLAIPPENFAQVLKYRDEVLANSE
ncbi:MAG: tetratricopeptide repeat protein [Gammaproteobacteria bacterium]|nr:tetratricopeptide repeat protein [Gammaproteobacteria bacterium]MYD80422.1 tetratricopeptide repeat protein [Gammaproteobacteria bacterium]